MRVLIIIIGLFFITSAYANKPELSINNIPIELEVNASSVIRESNVLLIIESSSKAILKEKTIITILNENGLRDSYFIQAYDKNSRIKNIGGSIYDKNGNKIKRMLASEIRDFSAISGFSVYEDNRVKFYNPEVLDYPFTVEYSYEIHLDGYINLPNWAPRQKFNMAVEKSILEVTYPSDLNIRFNENNVESAEKTIVNGKTHVLWAVTSLPALEEEPYMTSRHNYQPYIACAPGEFEYEGFAGNSETWQEFGNWIQLLNKERDVLPEESIITIKSIVDTLNTDSEKVKALYKYLQDNTRYVSIQLGIGGFQPFKAETVDRLKYGDCKALTNYLMSILNYSGIKSYYTLVGAGENHTPVMKDFPSTQFNHAFLCVPVENDTLWLECTSQRVPCGYIGDFTDDRDVLVINENGGTLVRTPKYTASQNSKVSTINVDLYSNGNALLQVKTNYFGPQMDEVLKILSLDKERKEKYLSNSLDVSKSKINSYQHSIDESIPCGKQELIVDVGSLATKMGSNLFLMPNILNKIEELDGDPEDRYTDIFIRRSESEIDTVIFNLQENITVSSLPKDVDIDSEFGYYSSKVSSTDKQLTYIRYFEIKEGTYPKEKINDLYDFFDKMQKADRNRVALRVETL